MSTMSSVVAVYDTHEQAEAAIKELQEAGVDMKSLSIAGIDTLQCDVFKKLLKGWPIHVPTGEAPVIVEHRKRDPSLMALAVYIRLAGLALGIERVERLLQALLGGLAGVEGTTDVFLFWSHFLTPKNAGPDHLVPVITNAIFDSDEYLSPR
jgi:hypothetical protein